MLALAGWCLSTACKSAAWYGEKQCVQAQKKGKLPRKHQDSIQEQALMIGRPVGGFPDLRNAAVRDTTLTSRPRCSPIFTSWQSRKQAKPRLEGRSRAMARCHQEASESSTHSVMKQQLSFVGVACHCVLVVQQRGGTDARRSEKTGMSRLARLRHLRTSM